MKKTIAIIVFASSIAWSAITRQQAITARDKAAAIQLSASQLVDLGTAVILVLDQGGTFTIPGSTQTYSITAQQNQDIVNNYNAIKTNICTTQCGALP